MINKIKLVWALLPKTGKVLLYVIISTILAEVLIELGGMEQIFFVRVSAQVVNVLIVFLQETVPAVRDRLTK